MIKQIAPRHGQSAATIFDCHLIPKASAAFLLLMLDKLVRECSVALTLQLDQPNMRPAKCDLAAAVAYDSNSSGQSLQNTQHGKNGK